MIYIRKNCNNLFLKEEPKQNIKQLLSIVKKICVLEENVKICVNGHFYRFKTLEKMHGNTKIGNI